MSTNPPIRLDDAAKAIIELLQVDGRRSYAEIAATVGLSETAVRQRVARMIEAGVMQIVAVTDPDQVGFTRQAMVGVRCTGDMTRVADELTGLAELTYVVSTAGSFDILAEAICVDDAGLLDVLRRIRAVDGVTSTETFTYLKRNKEHYDWGVR